MKISGNEKVRFRYGLTTSGFTLLEVMIAVAILSIAMVSLLGSQSQSVSVAGYSRFTVDTALLAQHKLAMIELEDFESLGSDSGNFGSEFPGYSWTTTVEEISTEELDMEEADGLLKRVDLQVFRESDEDNAIYLRSIVMANQVEAKK